MLRILLIAPWAGLLGSFIAVFCLALVSNPGPTDTSMILSVGLITGFLASVIVTIPACLIVGVPLIYLFRHQLREAPWRWSLLIAFLGMVIGALFFGWAVVSSNNPTGIKLVLLFSGTSALSFALLYGLTARRAEIVRGRTRTRTPSTEI